MKKSDRPIRHDILIVEDSLAEQQVIDAAFQQCGYECVLTFASTLEEAREKLARGAFNLIIIDLILGWQNGLDLVRELKSEPEFVAIPIVALSGAEHQILEAYKAGVNAFLTKGLSMQNFGKIHFSDGFLGKCRNASKTWLSIDSSSKAKRMRRHTRNTKR